MCEEKKTEGEFSCFSIAANFAAHLPAIYISRKI
jgi:hypothetical protein